MPEPAAAGLHRQDDVLADASGRPRSPRPCGPPGRARRRGRSMRPARSRAIGRPSMLERAVGRPVDAEQELGDLGPARSEQPGQADDLAGVERRGRTARCEPASPGRAPRARPRRRCAGCSPSCARTISSSSVRRAPEHERDQLQARQPGGPVGADEVPVAEDRDPVADLVDLVEEVGDEDDRDALVAQLAHDARRAARSRATVRLEVGSSRIRTLADEIDQRAGDGRHLLDGDRVGAERPGDVDLDVEAPQDLARPARSSPSSRPGPSASARGRSAGSRPPSGSGRG